MLRPCRFTSRFGGDHDIGCACGVNPKCNTYIPDDQPFTAVVPSQQYDGVLPITVKAAIASWLACGGQHPRRTTLYTYLLGSATTFYCLYSNASGCEISNLTEAVVTMGNITSFQASHAISIAPECHRVFLGGGGDCNCCQRISAPSRMTSFILAILSFQIGKKCSPYDSIQHLIKSYHVPLFSLCCPIQNMLNVAPKRYCCHQKSGIPVLLHIFGGKGSLNIHLMYKKPQMHFALHLIGALGIAHLFKMQPSAFEWCGTGGTIWESIQDQQGFIATKIIATMHKPHCKFFSTTPLPRFINISRLAKDEATRAFVQPPLILPPATFNTKMHNHKESKDNPIVGSYFSSKFLQSNNRSMLQRSQFLPLLQQFTSLSATQPQTPA